MGKKESKILILNWKMQPLNLSQALKTTQKLMELCWFDFDIWLAPPTIYFLPLKQKFPQLKIGLQNIYPGKIGAFTGEISTAMAKANRASFVIVGHSERRVYFKENLRIFLAKIKSALDHQLQVIFCFERLNEIAIVKKEIKKSPLLIFAYEPRKAISSFKGQSIEPSKVKKVKNYVQSFFPQNLFLYGGSVTPQNITSFQVDGFLIGLRSFQIKFVSQLINSFYSNSSISGKLSGHSSGS